MGDVNRERHNAYARDWRAMCRRLELCIACKEFAGGYSRCPRCRVEAAKRQRAYYSRRKAV